MPSNWEVLLHDAFVEELEQLNESLQDELFAHAKLTLQSNGIKNIYKT
jgi:hypothetical protein